MQFNLDSYKLQTPPSNEMYLAVCKCGKMVDAEEGKEALCDRCVEENEIALYQKENQLLNP